MKKMFKIGTLFFAFLNLINNVQAEEIEENMKKTEKRLNDELPKAISKWGWIYHHIGIPYDKPCKGETHHAHLKIYVHGFESSPYGIEWIRFEPDCPVPEILRKVPHVAFVVDNLDEELKNKEILLPPGVPSNGIKTAMIIDDGALVELMEFEKKL